MDPKRLAYAIARAVTGPVWHGPTLGELLRDVDTADAAAHPVAGAHSIWELVLHIAVWAEIAAERLDGRALEFPPPAEDWPAPEPASDEAWAAARERLEHAYRTLSAKVAGLEAEQLDAMVAGQDHPVWAMLHGVIEHACYHGGQIGLLRRALTGPD
ncbi:MAG: DinB family protein [Acidobacteriota bacterium]